MKKIVMISVSLTFMLSASTLAHAKNDKEKNLPPGLQKKVERGQSLPPGWQKKLAVGDILDIKVYNHGKVVGRDKKGLETISVEGKVIKIIENTREIVEILNGF